MSDFETASPLDVARRSFLRFNHERVLEVVDALPRTTVGKVDKQQLRERYAAE